MDSSHLDQWIEEMKILCKPSSVYICNGSEEEFQRLCQELVSKGSFIPLNKHLRPGSFLARSHPEDTARVEECTFICSKKKEDAGPTNNWEEPEVMRKKLRTLFAGCMEGRVMYVVPFCMGPLSSPLAKCAIEITDSPYVVCNMRLMTRMGVLALEEVKKRGSFIPCMHSVGVPLKKGEKDSLWPCQPKARHIVHFPEAREIWSFGSGYGGNALLGKKSLALRIASVIGRDEGWLAEHMLIVGVTSPQGEKHYIAAAFPSACGKTNLAMLKSSLPGWKVECMGDDIAWMRFGKDGRLYAINPEAGFFGVASGTSVVSNPCAMQTIEKNTIFTNVALTKEGDVWWEGKTKEAPDGLIDWLGNPWTAHSGTKAAHPNSRFTVSMTQCPVLDPAWNSKEGVPISAILFGSRRASTMPLLFESMNWSHGVFLGAALSSETTAAAAGELGKLRSDPFAMLPFCGYNMADYFAHWLAMEKKGDPTKLPKIFQVNWFRKNKEGKFIWPGFGDNMRAIEWIFKRLSNKVSALPSVLGNIPKKGDLDFKGLHVKYEELFHIDQKEIEQEVEMIRAFFTKFGGKMPPQMLEQLNDLKNRVHS